MFQIWGSRFPAAKAGALAADRGSTCSFHRMIPEIDIWRVAYLMLKRHGDEADTESAIRAEDLAEAGDRAGEAVWRRIMDAIGQLENTTPPGPVHSLPQTRGRRLHHPCELLPLFGDGGLDRSGNRLDQGRFCRRAQVQGGTHFLSKDFLRRFYRLNGSVGCSLHGGRRSGVSAEGSVGCYG